MDRDIPNHDTAAAGRYHNRTKHSEASLRGDPFTLDWPNQPLPFKIYLDLEATPLPRDPECIGRDTPPALAAIAATDAAGPGGTLDPCALAEVLLLSAGITKRKRYPGGEMYFRAYPNTGALYHVDVYLVTGPLTDLPAGVYQFAPHDFSLYRLRDGDYRAALIEASGAHPRVTDAPVTLITASTYWRNAWKYRARAYRHCYWDGGTLHANVLAIAGARGLAPEVVVGFADAAVAHLLGLDPEREGVLTLVPLGHGAPPAPAAPAPDRLDLATRPLSPSEIDYPEIRAMHHASSLADGSEVREWRRGSASGEGANARIRGVARSRRSSLRELPAPHEDSSRRERPPAREPPTMLSLPEAAQTSDSLSSVIFRRGSSRYFDRTRAIDAGALAAVLQAASRPVPVDCLEPGQRLVDCYLIVHAVAGVEPGAYVYHPESHALEPLRHGNFRDEAARLGLFQELPGDAAVNVYCLADLEEILARLGNRGYRAAQLAGGIAGGRMYLAAYALRFGATGLTFLDDDVIEFFSPHAAGKSVMFLAALGYPDLARLAGR